MPAPLARCDPLASKAVTIDLNSLKGLVLLAHHAKGAVERAGAHARLAGPEVCKALDRVPNVLQGAFRECESEGLLRRVDGSKRPIYRVLTPAGHDALMDAMDAHEVGIEGVAMGTTVSSLVQQLRRENDAEVEALDLVQALPGARDLDELKRRLMARQNGASNGGDERVLALLRASAAADPDGLLVQLAPLLRRGGYESPETVRLSGGQAVLTGIEQRGIGGPRRGGLLVWHQTPNQAPAVAQLEFLLKTGLDSGAGPARLNQLIVLCLDEPGPGLARAISGHDLLDGRAELLGPSAVLKMLQEHVPALLKPEETAMLGLAEAIRTEVTSIRDVARLGFKSSVPVDRIYVDLRLTARPSQAAGADRFPSRGGGGLLDGGEPDGHGDASGASASRLGVLLEQKEVAQQEKPKSPLEAVDGEPRLVIKGAPGCGKSTAMRHVALLYAKRLADAPATAPVPLLFHSAAWRRSGMALSEFIAAEVTRIHPPAAKHAEDVLSAGRFLLLADAFDELAGDQAGAAAAMQEFLRRHSGCRMVVASRTAGYHNELSDFAEADIQPLDDDQVRQSLGLWMEHLGRAEVADRLEQAVFATAPILALARTPLLLALICIIYHEDRQLPQRRVDLYARIMETMMQRWVRDRPREPVFPEVQKEAVVPMLALRMHMDRQQAMPEADAARLALKEVPALGDEAGALALLRELWDLHGVLRRVGRRAPDGSRVEYVEFVHLSLQEYLVAKWVHETQQVEALVPVSPDSWWREVFLMAVTLTGRRTKHHLGLLAMIPKSPLLTRELLQARIAADGETLAPRFKQEVVSALVDPLRQRWFQELGSEAFTVLRWVGDEAVPALLEFLRDPKVDDWARVQAARALGEVKAEAAVPALLEFLRDAKVDDWARSQAAWALGEMKAEAAVPALLDLVRDAQHDDWARGQAAWALGEMKAEAAVPVLLNLVRDAQLDDWARSRAAWALGQLKAQVAVPALLDFLRDAQLDSGARAQASEALGQLKGEAAVPALVDFLRDAQMDEWDRIRIADSLSRMDARVAAPAFLGILRDARQRAWLRGQSGWALGAMKIDGAARALQDFLGEPDIDDWARGRVAWALGELKAESAFPSLLDFLRDVRVDEWARGQAAWALGQLKAEAAVPALVDFLRDVRIDDRARGQAAWALGQLKAEAAVPALLDLLRDAELSAWARGHAAEALGQLKAEAAVPALLDVLHDTKLNVWARDQAAEALGQLKAEAAVPVLLDLVRGPSLGAGPQVRAAEALREMAGPGHLAALAEALTRTDKPWSTPPGLRMGDLALRAIASIGERHRGVPYQDESGEWKLWPIPAAPELDVDE